MKRRKHGFTLIEILVVIVVIAILATLVAPNVFQHVSTAKISTTKSQIEMLSTALDAYRLDNGQYPSTQQGLAALITKPTIDPPPTWRGPYLRKEIPLDPWNEPYQYVYPGVHNKGGYDLFSKGPDKAAGTKDDIGNWSEEK